MPRILQTFLLPTDDIFRRHAAWVNACDKQDLTRMAIAERAIDPFLRAIRKLGVRGFVRHAAMATDPLVFALEYSKDYYEAFPVELESEFKTVFQEVCTLFLLHGSAIYSTLSMERPRLSVVGMVAGDVEIGLLAESSIVQYV